MGVFPHHFLNIPCIPRSVYIYIYTYIYIYIYGWPPTAAHLLSQLYMVGPPSGTYVYWFVGPWFIGSLVQMVPIFQFFKNGISISTCCIFSLNIAIFWPGGLKIEGWRFQDGFFPESSIHIPRNYCNGLNLGNMDWSFWEKPSWNPPGQKNATVNEKKQLFKTIVLVPRRRI